MDRLCSTNVGGEKRYCEEAALEYYIMMNERNRESIRKIDDVETGKSDEEDAERLRRYSIYQGPFRFAVRFAFNNSRNGRATQRMVYSPLFPRVWERIPEDERARYLNENEMRLLRDE